MNIDDLHSLISQISAQIQKGHTLSQLTHLFNNYKGNDWKSFVKFNDHTHCKNFIYQSQSFDVILICWKQNQKTKIHDHPAQGCLMKVLIGQLNENIYQLDPYIQYISTHPLFIDQIGYKEGNSILHEIHSPVQSISLHIYSPGGYQAKYYETTHFN